VSKKKLVESLIKAAAQANREFLRRNHSDLFRFKRATFYQSLKSKVGLAALRINLNIEDCGIVAAQVHGPSRAPLLFPLLLSHNLSPVLLVRDGQTSPHSLCGHRPRLVVSRSTCPPLSPSPHANSFEIGTTVINTHTH
jgi:hypothetical protein